MQSGLLWGTVAQVEGLIARVRAELAGEGVAGPVRVFSTGGFGRLLGRHLPSVEAHMPYLVVYGLGLIHARATGSPEALDLSGMAGGGVDAEA